MQDQKWHVYYMKQIVCSARVLCKFRSMTVRKSKDESCPAMFVKHIQSVLHVIVNLGMFDVSQQKLVAILVLVL